MDTSRVDARTVALALLCVVVVAFAAATLDSTTNPESGFGAGSFGGDESGYEGTPTAGDPGESDEGRPSLIDVEFGGFGTYCVEWLKRPLAQATLLLGWLGLFLVARWYDDAALGLAVAFLVGYPGFFLYFLLTACRQGRGILPDLSRIGSPTASEGGGLLGGQGSPAAPSLLTQILLVLVVGLLGVVAVLVLTGDHEQLSAEAEEAEEEAEPGAAGRAAEMAAIGAAAGRAADRIEAADAGDAFENEVYRAWAEMTEPLAVEHPESSTPAEFATAAVDAGMAPADVDHLTRLFEEVRYGGAEPTPERERDAVAALRRIEATYADADEADAGRNDRDTDPGPADRDGSDGPSTDESGGDDS